MIELVHLQKKYERVTPLEDVNATINDGDIISVIGAYGGADMPEGTIVTAPYFSDLLVPVLLAGGGPQGK